MTYFVIAILAALLILMCIKDSLLCKKHDRVLKAMDILFDGFHEKVKEVYRMEGERRRIQRERDATAKMAERLLTERDREISHLIRLVHQKKLKVKHQ